MKLRISDAVHEGGRTVIPTGWLRLARRPDRVGRLAELAIMILTEARWQEGDRPWGDYRVRMKRGQTLVSVSSLAKEMGSQRRTVKKWLALLCADMGWEIETLTTDDPYVLGRLDESETDPVSQHNLWHKGGGNLGHKVTITNYDDLQRIVHKGEHKGGHGQEHKGSAQHTTSGSPTPGSPTTGNTTTPPRPPPPGGGKSSPSSDNGDAREMKDMREHLERSRKKGATEFREALSLVRQLAGMGSAPARELLREESER